MNGESKIKPNQTYKLKLLNDYLDIKVVATKKTMLIKKLDNLDNYKIKKKDLREILII